MERTAAPQAQPEDFLGDLRGAISVHVADSRVIASLQLPPSVPLDEDGEKTAYAVVATTACRHGAEMSGANRRLAKESALYFEPVGGSEIRAEAHEVHRSQTDAIWRATILRRVEDQSPQWTAVAEITQNWTLASETSGGKESSLVILDTGAEDSVAGRLSIKRGASEERRSQILKAAYKVISQRGYANASMREIAQTAQLPIATVYLYIKSKEELLFQISALLLGDMKETLRKKIEEHASPVEKLKTFIESYTEYCGKNRRFINLVYREGKSLSEENRQKILDLDKSFVRFWTDIIAEGKRTKVFDVDNPELIANYIYFLCSSWSIRHWNLKRFGERAVVDSITALSLRTLGVDEHRSPKK